MKSAFINKKGASLIEIVIAILIVAIAFTTIMSSMNVFSEILLKNKDKKTKLSDLISAANEFYLNKDNVTRAETLNTIDFTLENEQITLPIRIITYSIKSDSEKKLITFSKY